MNTILYKCTDFGKAGLSSVESPYNQFTLSTVKSLEHSHKEQFFIDLFSVQRVDFNEFHKSLPVYDIRYHIYDSAAWRLYDEFKQYFEPICDLADYRLITKEESVLYDQDAILQLHFARGNILYFVNSQKKQSIAYVLYKINQRTTCELHSFFLIETEESFLTALADHQYEALSDEYETSLSDEQKEYFSDAAQKLLHRKEKISHFSDQLMFQTVEMRFKLEEFLK